MRVARQTNYPYRPNDPCYYYGKLTDIVDENGIIIAKASTEEMAALIVEAVNSQVRKDLYAA